jgi:PAS domain S-box-containing protein
MASVLIVDDERSIRLTLGAFLMAAGHDVSVADDLGPALDVVANSELPLDVVVTDILLTTGSGLDILDAVRDRRPHVHVVLMTGQPTLASAGKAIRGRAFDYLAKPVSKETLLDVVERAAAAKSRAEEFERLQAEREQYRHRLEQEVAERTAALAAGEARYRLLVEHQTDLIVKFDLKQRILYASPSYCRTFGRSAEELVGEKFTPLIHEEDRAAVSASLALALEPPYMTRHEERALTVDGWRWFEWLAHGVPDDDGEVRSVVATGRDITEVKSARASLEESERKFRTLVDQVGEALFLHAPDGTLLDVNARAVARYGYTRRAPRTHRLRHRSRLQ